MHISLKHISYRYPNGTLALDDISLDIPENKNIAFLGANGSGKSSLFLLLAGLLKPCHGEYYIKGEKQHWNKRGRNAICRQVGLVFQDPDVQILGSTVYKEVAFGPLNLRLPVDEIHARTQQAMSACDISHLAETNPQSLSFGQKKMVAIASILAMESETLVFDEPLAWLDPRHKKDIIGTLLKLQRGGKSILVSTHDTSFAYQWADEIYVLHKGKVALHGTPDEVFAQAGVLAQSELNQPLEYTISQLAGRRMRSADELAEWITQNISQQ